MVRISRRPPEDEDITAFWLVTYSDMVTLLLAFFLLMYSFRVMGSAGQEQLVDELRSVTENRAGAATPRPELEAAAREIAAQFRDAQAYVESTEAEVTVGLSSEVTFAVGDDALSEGARAALVRAAEVLARLPNTIRVEGHTDAVPVRTARYASNWHLSAARAQSVVRLLLDRGVDPRRLQVVGYGDVRPRAGNDTPEGRATNRRIEIKILRGAGDAR